MRKVSVLSGASRQSAERAGKKPLSVGRRRKLSVTPSAAPLATPKACFRERLSARLDQAEVPVNRRMAFVAELTGRAVQTVSRWFDAERSGLPDLESYLRLCSGLHCSADWMLGLSETPSGKSPSRTSKEGVVERWMVDLLGNLRDEFHGCELMRMSGDEMTPKIFDGDTLFVNRDIGTVFGNGIYMVEWKGRTMVRRVECRIGEGFALSCENPNYAECLVKDTATARRMGLRFVGKVNGVIRAVHYWAQ